MIDSTGIKLDITGTETHLPPDQVDALAPAVTRAAADLAAGACPGADYLGWLDLPESISAEELKTYTEAAAQARDDTEICVVIGIGGSYLGAHAVLNALKPAGDAPEIIFAGTGLCSAGLSDILAHIRDRHFRLCVISKSGTTLEPAVAFRMLRNILIEKYGPRESAKRITAITDARKGALLQLAQDEGYETFVIPDNVGGRFSVLTPVGLLPLAIAGVDVGALVEGARTMRQACQTEDLRANPAHLYAAVRHGLYKQGFGTEILSTFHSRLQTLQEWWKQLFGESEGKQGGGIFPASTVFTTDLHSLGQYIQDGRRNLQETFLVVRNGVPGLKVPAEGRSGQNLDGLNYLAGRSLDEINWQAFCGTRSAHGAGGVPYNVFEIDELTPRTIGGLIYLFEKAVAVSGLLQGVNPFDQPGVEAYKKEMFRLLGKQN